MKDGKARWLSALADGSIVERQNHHTPRVQESSRQSSALLRYDILKHSSLHERYADVVTAAGKDRNLNFDSCVRNKYLPESRHLVAKAPINPHHTIYFPKILKISF